MASKLFHMHGKFCASHPWEVIVATLTLTLCMLFVDQQYLSAALPRSSQHYCSTCIPESDYNAADMVVMTFIRCIAVLYSYYQFRAICKFRSKNILVIAGLFTVFSSFVFTSTVLNFLKIDAADLKDALFFFLLLIDLSKAALLADLALGATNQEEIISNIARGMSTLGPKLSLDTLVETLVIGIGTLSGVHRLEILSYFACLSALVNYLVFMTFYPACLSLVLELSRSKNNYAKTNIKNTILGKVFVEDKSNPLVERVKIIMSAGLLLVHVHSRWPFRDSKMDEVSAVKEAASTLNKTSDVSIQSQILKWVTLSADHIVILIILLALVIKFIFFENKEEIAEQLRTSSMQNYQSTLVSETFVNKSGSTPGNTSGNTYVTPSETNIFSKTGSTSQTPFEQSPRRITSVLRQRFQTRPYFTTGSFFLDELECQHNEVILTEKEIQTELPQQDTSDDDTPTSSDPKLPPRTLEECLKIYRSDLGAACLTDEEVILLVENKQIAPYQIEKAINNPERGVKIRRKILGNEGDISQAFMNLPYKNYDYTKVYGACCENVVGYVPIPVGVAGPLLLDDELFYIPLATTEGCLVASTNRGCRALSKCGVKSSIVADGMTRGPVVRFPSMKKASDALMWMEDLENFQVLKERFDSTSRFARLTKLHIRIAGRYLFIRFVATTGDAMGMNMLSKGTEESLRQVHIHFPEMEILSLSGNFCTDKKPSAINWIQGRGKSVVCEAVVPSHIVTSILKTTVQTLVDVNISKNLIGSAMAGSIGGFNAHAANVVTAIFIATGQDPAQNVGSSNCITIMEPWGTNGEDLYISCSMPSIEIGTIGGGTILPAQAACLDMLGVKGPNFECPGENAKQLARIVCGSVLAGELSLMAALATGHLVKSHLKHNRSSISINCQTSR